jgi:hypothetical protein
MLNANKPAKLYLPRLHQNRNILGRKKRPISINNESSLQLPESKGIELKSFSFNINYDRVTGVVLMDS